MAELTQARLRELLNYNPETGKFYWICDDRERHHRAGAEAGISGPRGYVCFNIDGKRVWAHRAAWLYQTGKLPKGILDHINRQRDDNRFANLREASLSQNQGNSKLHKHNTSGFRGVRQLKSKKWRAYIYKYGKQHRLGLFNTAREAQEAYSVAAKDHFGEFAPPNYERD